MHMLPVIVCQSGKKQNVIIKQLLYKKMRGKNIDLTSQTYSKPYIAIAINLRTYITSLEQQYSSNICSGYCVRRTQV